MKIKTVALNEIHWTLDQWNQGQQANDRLAQKLGPLSNFFAKCNVGANFYSWSVDAPGKWTSLTDAPDNEAANVRQKWEELKLEVVAKLSPANDLAEKLLTVPNEEYIYYRTTPDGQLSLLITGWGFRNFKKAGPHMWGSTPEADTTHPVDVAFTIEGVRQPGRSFFIVAPKTRNEYTTGANGLYRVGEKVTPGTVINIVDSKTEKPFEVTVDDSRIEYDLDVTQFVPLKVLATLDDQPIAQGDVNVKYGKDDINLMLTNGKAAVNVPLREGTPCTVTFGDKQQTQYLTLDNSTFTFAFVTPKPEVVVPPIINVTPGAPVSPGVEVPPVQQPRLVRVSVVDSQQHPMAQQRIVFRQGNVVQQMQLDNAGGTLLDQTPFNTALPLTAQLVDTQLPEIEFTFDEGENEYLLQQLAPSTTSRATEIVAAIAILLALVGIGYLTRLGIDQLVPLINHNIL